MKKKIPVYILVTLFLYLMQTTIFHYMKILEVKPNLLLVFVCVMAYMRGSSEGLALGLGVGLFADIMVGKVIGFYAMIFMFAGLITGLVPRRVFYDNMFLVLALSMIVIAPAEYLIYWLSKIADYIAGNTEKLVVEPLMYLIKRIFPEIIYNSIVFPLIYLLCRRIDKFFNKDVKEFVN